MSPEGSIKVDHVWKRFRMYRGRRLLKDRVDNVFRKMRGRARKNPWLWALKDIDFSVEPGESIGLVGANGSGKSTLLKIISQVMFPHSGRVETQGRVGALLEVTSGIHNDLTGRENVAVYGSLLGIGRKEIARRFDDVVAFAELEHAIDKHVKFYSSGMKMRLGFSIAAFLEPSILLVDEVLAVGDSSFQQKCMERMREVLQGGSTLILVSHDLASVGAIASRGLWLSAGRLRADGPVNDVLAAYRREIEELTEARSTRVEGRVTVGDLVVSGPEGRLAAANEPCTVRLTVHTEEERRVQLFVGVSQGAPTPIFVLRHVTVIPAGETRLTLRIARLPLPAGDYFLWFGANSTQGSKAELSPWQPIGPLNVAGFRLDPVPRSIVRLSPVFVESEWTRD